MSVVSRSTAPPRIAILLAFASVYLCWGATYTAMSIGVHLLPATILAGTRMLAGAAIMFTFCALAGKQLFYSPKILLRLGLVGVLMLLGGNLGLVWSEKYLPSGLAALIVAVVPLYVAGIEMLLPSGERLRARGFAGIALGLVALAVLLWPSFHQAVRTHGHNGPTQFIAALVVLAGALSWATGSVLFRHMRLPVDPFVAAGWEMLAAGIGNSVIATITWQWPHAAWNSHSIGAVSYLVLFGSLLGFTCYLWLIHHVPVAKVATYAYVNPVVAVILGALILHEHLRSSEYIGMIAVLCAVALVTSSRMKSGRSVAEVETLALEPEA